MNEKYHFASHDYELVIIQYWYSTDALCCQLQPYEVIANNSVHYFFFNFENITLRFS